MAARRGSSPARPQGQGFDLDGVVLRVRDLASALAWYRERLGLTPARVDERAGRAVFEFGRGARVTLWQLRRIDRELAIVYAGTFPCLATDDIERAWRDLREHDVLVEPIEASPDGRSFELRDLDGNRLDVVERTTR